MRKTGAVCATLVGALLLTGGSAFAYDPCPPGRAAAGLCAPLHFVDDDDWRREVLQRRSYQRGYQDGVRGYDRGDTVPPPPPVALDSKEGYSQGYRVHRRYVERDQDAPRYRDRDEYFGRYNERDYYDRRRYRRSDTGDVFDSILRGLLD